MKICPNINDRQYKSLAAQVGTAKAHTIYAMNNGNPVSLNADGSPSLVYESIKKQFGEYKAIQARTKMFTDSYLEMTDNSNDKPLNEAMALILDNGVVVNLLGRGRKSKAIQKHILRQEVLETSEMVDALIGSINSVLPGLKIIKETFATTKGTKHENERAWIDKDGMHFNIQSMTYDTPVHEIAHLWINSVEQADSTMFMNIMSMVDESIDANRDIYEIIKRKYPTLSEIALRKEYAATIAGFVGANQIRKFYYRNNVYLTPEKAQQKTTTFMGFIENIWNAIKQVFSKLLLTNQNTTSALAKIDFKTATLDDVFMSLTEDIIVGGVVNFGQSTVDTLLERYITNESYDASKILFENMNPITTIGNVMPYLMNRKDVSTSFDEAQKELDVKHIMSTGLHENNGYYVYYDLGKRYSFPTTISPELLAKRIREEIIDKRYEFFNSFTDKMMLALKDYDNYRGKKSVEQVVLDVFGEKLPPTIVDQLVNTLKLIGVDHSITQIMSYKDLRTHPKYSHLYSPALDSFNYMVIIHSEKDGEIDMSLIDVANGKLGWSNNMLPGNMIHLASSLGYDGALFTYSNRVVDIRKSLLGVTLAGINKMASEKNQKIRIRKVGVIGNDNLHISTHMISNIHEALKNGRQLFMLPEVHELMDKQHPNYEFIMNLVADDNAFNGAKIMQSWRNVLESFYMANRVRLGLSSKYVNDILYDTQLLRERQLDIKKNNKDYLNDPEFKFIGMQLMYLESHIDINGSQMEDMKRKWKDVTNPHNVKHDALQLFSITAEETKSMIVDQLNGYKDKFQELAEKSLKSHGKVVHIMGNKPEDVFGHLFKKSNDIILYNRLYGSYDIKEAKAAGLTDADIEFADYIHEQIIQRYTDNEMHRLKMKAGGMEAKRQDIEAEIRGKLYGGRIPVMPMTRSEMMRRGQHIKAFKKNIDKVAKGELAAGETTTYNAEYNEIHYAYTSQLDINEQHRQMGLEYNALTNTYTVLDQNQLNQNTMNLEYTFNMFMHDGIRKVLIDTRLIPMYDNVKVWFNMIKEEFGKGSQGQRVAEEYLDDYYNRVVLRRNRDENDKVDAFIRNATHLFSFVALGYRPTVWMRSAYYNMQNMFVEGVATKVSSSINEEVAEQLKLPSISDMSKANAVIMTDFAKIYALGKKFTVINSSEMEAIDSIFTTKMDRHGFKTQLSQVGNYYSDIIARLITMTAFMIRDGSYEAHTYDKDKNELSYDVTKDKRFYKDGNWINENAKIIYNKMEKDIKSVGLERDGKIYVGYDFRDANTRFKWYADKFVIGSMDEYQKVLLGQTAFGAMAMQFRNYLPDRLFNLFGSTRKTMYGTTRSIRINADNEVEVIRKQIEIEGAFTSWLSFFDDVVKVIKHKDLTWQELKENMSPMRRQNMAKSAIQAVLLTSIVLAIYMLAKSGLSDRDRKKLEFLWSELVAWRPITDMFETSILPISKVISDIWSIMTGEGNWNRMMRYTMPVYDILWYTELVTEWDDILMTNRQKKKLSDMTEKEQEEYRLRREEVKRKREKTLKDLSPLYGNEE